MKIDLNKIATTVFDKARYKLIINGIILEIYYIDSIAVKKDCIHINGNGRLVLYLPYKDSISSLYIE